MLVKIESDQSARDGDLCDDAGLGRDVTLHVLKHTAVTCAHQPGYSGMAAEEMLGTTRETLHRNYEHWGEGNRHRFAKLRLKKGSRS
ncbi:hypothetical protein HNQ36_002763 [Afipia massiliensis]|uniref:Helix-turn-helix domain-containing protein n=1 Tax=Afipia massiliensis TaxID=211460 RepID=A0A840MWU2_9BRAD|nr:hypothetical protein [Afipia massiliensis]MBB5052789.1 hypothetical protein [Afipia massiliensis]